MEFDIGIEMIQTAFFILKVSRMTMKMSSGETVKMMAPTSLNLWSITRNLRIQSGVMMMTRRVLEALEFIIIMKA